MGNWTGNSYVDALLVGTKLGTSSVNVYFNTYDASWLTLEVDAAMNAFDSWSNVADITFTRVYSSFSANLIENQIANSANPGALGQHDLVIDYNSNTISTTNLQLQGYFNYYGIGWDSFNSTGGLSVGGYGYDTLVHEFGHALGLDHTHADSASDPNVFPGVSSQSDTGDNQLNQDVYSIMSYVSGVTTKAVNGGASADNYGYVAGPMAFDIAAIQYLYGANTTQNSGDNTYTLPDANENGTYYTAIWDTGGTDEIVYNGTKDVEINLHSATLQNETGGGGFLSAASGIKGGFTIAADFTDALADENGETGVIIENATSGSGNDNLKGNDVANVLSAGAGNDTVYGYGGDDRLYGGDGNDFLLGNDGNDKLYGQNGDDKLAGYAGDDYIRGQDGNDKLYGGDGNDFLLGDGGNDKLYGQNGDDKLAGYAGNDYIRGQDGNDKLYGGDGDDFLLGDAGNDKLYGQNGNDKLAGYAGDDYIRGQDGVDLLYGGDGNDFLLGDGGNDKLYGQNGNDKLAGYAGNDYMRGQDGQDLIYGGDGNDRLLGDAGNDKLYGQDGDDIINGGAGNDYLRGQAGADSFVFADNFGVDRIKDFSTSEGDKIDLSGVQSITDWNELVSNHLSNVDGHAVITDGANTITLMGTIVVADLHESDFIFYLLLSL